MKKKNSILRSIDLAEQRFFEDNTKNPDILIVNPVGYALLSEAVGPEVYDDDYKYEDKYLVVCPHSNFPLFALAYSGE